MKRVSYIILVLVISVCAFVKCQKRPEMKIYNLEIQEETIAATTNSVEITVKYTYPTKLEYVNAYLSINGDLSNAAIVQATIEDDSFTVTFSNLLENTRYFYRFEYSNGVNLINTEIHNFMTGFCNLPVVITSEVTEITSNSALCGGNVTSDGNGTVTDRGLCYATKQTPTIYDNVINCGDSLGVFEALIENLDINTTYYVRAYATNEKGTAYGEQKSFTTLGQVPTIVTIPITSITASTAVSGGTITDNGGNEVTEKGVCWSTEQYPTTDDAHTSDGTGNGAYVSNLTDLSPNTTYYVRAYATNSQGTGYGNELTFTTSASLAVVITKEVTDVTETSAKCGGDVINDGGVEITARGVCWSTEHNPTISDTHTEDGSGIGEFDSEITGLSTNTTYYVRAYATNSYGTAYGEEKEFATAMGIPEVTTKSITAITASSATCGGNVTNSGGGTITARGVCWGTTQNPTITDPHTADGTGIGEFTSHITGLSNNTTYYVRAYATNSNGTAYGEERSFSTQEGLAVVVTADVTNVTATSASSGGEVTDDGGFSITARGVCWSTAQNPTTSDAHTSDGTGTGSYTSSLSSLSYNTTYYVRAYATNSKGTSYGEEKMFTTSKIMPTVTTKEVTSVTSNSAVCGGNVTNDGGANVTARGVCYSTSQNPTISGQHTTDGNGTGQFTSNLTGLTENTTYYVRAYATNSEGTSYGEQKTFSTSHDVIAPTVTTNDVSDISTTTATCGGDVTSAGYGTVSARGVCWSTSQNPTTSNSHTTNGSGTGTYTSSITGLTENTTYYVRAYATNEAGTAYGEQKTFTTPHAVSLPTVTTNNVTEITTSTAVSGGNVTSAGYGTVSDRGICWSTSQNPTINDSHTADGNGTGSFTSNLTGLTDNTTYYVRAYATNEAGTAYGSQKSFTTEELQIWDNGILPGTFSVSATKQVHFSQGNLQYIGNTTTPYWKFASKQWEFLGGYDNGQQTDNKDLFCWGTSGYNHGAVCYQPWTVTGGYYDFWAYGTPFYSLNDSTGKADWGYNAISNGGNQENQWRTLQRSEWSYILFTRSTPSNKRYAAATVNGIKGLIILPDNWISGNYPINNPNAEYADFNSNIIDAETWLETLENYGAVFLPMAGIRDGATVNTSEDICRYWTATAIEYNGETSYCLYIGAGYIGAGDYWDHNRIYGLPVRLVHDAN